MKTISVKLDDDTAPSQVLDLLSKQCERHNLADSQQVVQTVRDVACDLDRRGQELAAMGSQFSTTRVLEFPNCRVEIIASYGVPRRRSLFRWLQACFQRDEVGTP